MAFLRLFYSVPAFRRWRRSLGRPCPPGRSPRFEHRQHFLGEELQAPLRDAVRRAAEAEGRSEEHTSELQSLMRNSYAVLCVKIKRKGTETISHATTQTNP